MKEISQADLDQIFLTARTQHGFEAGEISDETLHRLYDLMKWGPTAGNSNPVRLVFVKSGPAKEKLLGVVSKGNVEQTRAAPVTVIVAQDLEFYEHLPKLFPAYDARAGYIGKPDLIKTVALRNSSLQGAYLIIAARALGLDCGPMSGFDNDALDQAFFAGTPWKSNFLCNLGKGDPAKVFPRGPRLDFDEACKIL